MFTEMMMSAGGGGGGYVFIDDITNVECVAAVNPNGTSRNLSIPNIPKTKNVIYALSSKNYSSGLFTVGNKYNLKSFTSSFVIVLDDNGISIDFSNMNYTLSGNTLSTSQSATYSNYGLFIIGEK